MVCDGLNFGLPRGGGRSCLGTRLQLHFRFDIFPASSFSLAAWSGFRPYAGSACSQTKNRFNCDV